MIKFELGEELQDVVTGYKGIVMGRTDYFTGCVHYGLAARELKDGKTLDWEWFDETRLSKIGNGIRFEVEKSTSGPMPHAPSM
jgi:hypothetical protein